MKFIYNYNYQGVIQRAKSITAESRTLADAKFIALVGGKYDFDSLVVTVQ
jgi:hypothetical protein